MRNYLILIIILCMSVDVIAQTSMSTSGNITINNSLDYSVEQDTSYLRNRDDYGRNLAYSLRKLHRLTYEGQTINDASTNMYPDSAESDANYYTYIDTFKIMYLGDSNTDTQDGAYEKWITYFIDSLRARFPDVPITDTSYAIAGGGWWAPMYQSVNAVITWRPDLIFIQNLHNDRSLDLFKFYAFGQRLIENIQYNSVADICLMSYHKTKSTPPATYWESTRQRYAFRDLADQYNLEYIDIAWKQLDELGATGNWGTPDFTDSDSVHLNTTGSEWVCNRVLEHFPKNKRQRNYMYNDQRIRFYEPTNNFLFPYETYDKIDRTKWQPYFSQIYWNPSMRGWIASTDVDTIDLWFVGSSVEIWTYGNKNAAYNNDAVIYIDDLPPSEHNLIFCTRTVPDAANDGNKRLGRLFTAYAEKGVAVAEDWTITFTSDTEYNLVGSVTGADGTGSKSADFTSTSGAIKIFKDF